MRQKQPSVGVFLVPPHHFWDSSHLSAERFPLGHPEVVFWNKLLSPRLSLLHNFPWDSLTPLLFQKIMKGHSWCHRLKRLVQHWEVQLRKWCWKRENRDSATEGERKIGEHRTMMFILSSNLKYERKSFQKSHQRGSHWKEFQCQIPSSTHFFRGHSTSIWILPKTRGSLPVKAVPKFIYKFIKYIRHSARH